ncbi:hypothetical protein BDV3_004651 [Batrachochytrium dendrobatidis]|nr:actin binding protein [Batrachochytrium dendrobatidis]KAK5672281.1 actin binding protein [Batrachochytrium dendrobatidis]
MASSTQVNLSTYSNDISAAYASVLSEQDSCNWAIFSYDKGGNDLKLFGSGDGGLEELSDEFEEGKIQYAFAKVFEPVSGLPKYVFIAWCGDGVPVAKKGLFHYHVNDIAKYFKGFHVQINARGNDDIDPDLIMKKVRDSAGAKYSIHQHAQNQTTTSNPSTSVAVPTASTAVYTPSFNRAPHSSVASEANSSKLDSQSTHAITAGLKSTSINPISSAAKPSRPTYGGYGGYASVQTPPSKQSSYQPPVSATSNEISGVQAERERREKDEREQRERAEQEYRDRMAREQEQSAQLQKTNNELNQQKIEREKIELQQQHQKDLQERQRIASEKRQHMEQQQAEADARLEKERQAKEQFQRNETTQVQHNPPHVAAVQTLNAKALYDYSPEESNEIPFLEEELITHVIQVDEGWWEGTNAQGQRGLFPSNYVELIDSNVANTHVEPSALFIEPVPAQSIPHDEPIVPTQQDIHHENNTPYREATAVYDYVAAEPNELSFNEGNLITHIVFVSEDWWQGTLNGVVGLFPGNYVELKQ